jgi:hypothetical protein
MRAEPLRHDALEPELTGVPKYRRSVLVGVFIQQNSGGLDSVRVLFFAQRARPPVSAAGDGLLRSVAFRAC